MKSSPAMGRTYVRGVAQFATLAAIAALAACGGGDDAGDEAPDCDVAFADASSPSVADYEAGCTLDGRLVSFARIECVDRPGSVLYTSDLGAGRSDGAFFRYDHAVYGDPDDARKQCTGELAVDDHTRELGEFVLSMCLTESSPAEVRAAAEAKGWSADDVEFVVTQTASCP